MPSKHYDSFFYFTRKSRRGTLLLLVLVLIICIVPFVYPLFINSTISEVNKFDSALATLKTKQLNTLQKKFVSRNEENYRPYDNPSSEKYDSKPKGVLFYFDPNSINAEEWKKLGLRDKTIATILNYRSKGGKFREPEDIKKIWGLFPDEAERLIPFIRITSSDMVKESDKNNYAVHQPIVVNKNKPLVVIDINTADTSDFIALPGIGSKLSQRIINFRNKLGGFYSINQVAETFGLPDSVFKKIKPMLMVSAEVKKLSINSASLDELKLHPYIKYQLANALVQYRAQHGDYNSIEEIKKIMIINDELFNKIYPYLAIK